ncbi:MAG: dipeptide epimerase [candidate division KSB1 bacterium]|nr:dipeptide epimerase [candidate division KSB1 bacterium]
MKIIKVEAWPIELKLSQAYTIAYESIDSAINVILRIETDHGLVGFGCAAPDEYITGENERTVMNAIQQAVVPILNGADPLRTRWLLEQIRAAIGEQNAALAAVDIALYDLLGKCANLPLWRLLGGFRDRIATSVTVGILPEAETVAQALLWTHQGFKCLKLKGGLDVDADIVRVMKVREAVGHEVALRFDANQGYTVAQAIKFAEQTQTAELEFIEQPTSKDDREGLKYLAKHLPLLVMADESVISLTDTIELAKAEGANLLNVKLMKMGGITEALQICAVARSKDISVMVGCMDESVLGIAGGLHVALSQPNIKYADLDGHLGLLNDPFVGGVVLKDGMLFPTDNPGLGCDQVE